MQTKKSVRILKLLTITFGIIVLISCILAVAGIRFYNSVDFDPAWLSHDKADFQGTLLTDRYGRELRFLPDEKGERRRWLKGAEIPDIVKNAFIAAEDKRFLKHNGFDLIAILRALKDNTEKGKITSGASTISQQLIRLVQPDGKRRTYRSKLVEIVRSIKMEESFSKQEIMEQYLNRIPFGNNLIGIDTASRAYFGRHANSLSANEAALLASLPKAPGILNPYGSNLQRLFKRKDWVLKRMFELDFLPNEKYHDAKNEKLSLKKLSFDTKAPHLIDQLSSYGINNGIIKTTLDLNLQIKIQQILSSHTERLRLRKANQAAAIVIYNSTMEVLATVGSLEFSEKDGGFNNNVLAKHSAGSTLKPFLYALAIESGFTASSLIEDTERKYSTAKGQYTPSNFDRKEYGPVTMRSALGNSLNISAVKMLNLVGIEQFYNMLLRMDMIKKTKKGPDYYGLGLAIGNPEISLEQLAVAYAMLANGGILQPARYLLEKSPKSNDINKKNILMPQTAYIITNILSDPGARMLTFGNRNSMNFPYAVSVKTGTSTFFRDLWAVAYTSDYTVAVWVGNVDGSPTNKLSGSTAAAPILSDIMNFLYRRSSPTPFTKPKGLKRIKVCGYSGMKPTKYCMHTVYELFISGAGPISTCTFHKKEAIRHDVGATYAGWLFEKGKTGSTGRFKLTGFDAEPEIVFDDPWKEVRMVNKEPAVRIKNTADNKNLSFSDNEIQHKDKFHFTIGTDDQFENNPSGIQDTDIKIIYPFDQDNFVLNRNFDNQVIKLQAVTSETVPYVDWYINGYLYKRTGPPYQTFWPMEKGVFQITVVSPFHDGHSVRIKIE